MTVQQEVGQIHLPQKQFQDEKGRFKKGTHWREPKPYWSREWLFQKYITEKLSSAEIANQFGCRDANILYFLRKFGITTRTMNEARKIKHWGASGINNPMYGRLGFLNPRWNGGHSPERQSAYARHFWKELAKSILKRDEYECKKCGGRETTHNGLEVHHVKPWSAYPELRFEPSNLITLCHKCHTEVTRRR